MKYRGKKISTLIALGLTSVGLTLAALKKPIPNPFGTHEVVSEDNTYVPEEVIKEITEELKDKEIVLDGKYSKYIKGITIDYDHISIDLVNDEKIEGTIIVYSLFAVLSLISPFVGNNDIESNVNKSFLGKMVYKNNIIVNTIGK